MNRSARRRTATHLARVSGRWIRAGDRAVAARSSVSAGSGAVVVDGGEVDADLVGLGRADVGEERQGVLVMAARYDRWVLDSTVGEPRRPGGRPRAGGRPGPLPVCDARDRRRTPPRASPRPRRGLRLPTATRAQLGLRRGSHPGIRFRRSCAPRGPVTRPTAGRTPGWMPTEFIYADDQPASRRRPWKLRRRG